MEKIQLGATDLRIAPLVFGSLPLGPLQANLSAAEGGRLIRHALECGVDLIDTAALYGTYPHIRAALEGYRGTVFIATKTHALDAAGARSHVETALREMNRDVLDIVHLHGARLANPFADRAEVLAELVRMRAEGKLRYLGLSSHYISAMRLAVECADIAVLHPLINAGGMGILDGSAAEMAVAIEVAAASGKGIYAMKALAGGNRCASARDSLCYVRDLPGVHATAVGMLSPAEIDANLALLCRQEDLADWTTLQNRRRKLRIMEAFCKGCGKCLTACSEQGLSLLNGKATVDETRCILCGYCAAACPEFIIRVN